jgi:hypothetical protein
MVTGYTASPMRILPRGSASAALDQRLPMQFEQLRKSFPSDAMQFTFTECGNPAAT